MVSFALGHVTVPTSYLCPGMPVAIALWQEISEPVVLPYVNCRGGLNETLGEYFQFVITCERHEPTIEGWYL